MGEKNKKKEEEEKSNKWKRMKRRMCGGDRDVWRRKRLSWNKNKRRRCKKMMKKEDVGGERARRS